MIKQESLEDQIFLAAKNSNLLHMKNLINENRLTEEEKKSIIFGLMGRINDNEVDLSFFHIAFNLFDLQDVTKEEIRAALHPSQQQKFFPQSDELSIEENIIIHENPLAYESINIINEITTKNLSDKLQESQLITDNERIFEITIPSTLSSEEQESVAKIMADIAQKNSPEVFEEMLQCSLENFTPDDQYQLLLQLSNMHSEEVSFLEHFNVAVNNLKPSLKVLNDLLVVFSKSRLLWKHIIQAHIQQIPFKDDSIMISFEETLGNQVESVMPRTTNKEKYKENLRLAIEVGDEKLTLEHQQLISEDLPPNESEALRQWAIQYAVEQEKPDLVAALTAFTPRPFHYEAPSTLSCRQKLDFDININDDFLDSLEDEDHALTLLKSWMDMKNIQALQEAIAFWDKPANFWQLAQQYAKQKCHSEYVDLLAKKLPEKSENIIINPISNVTYNRLPDYPGYIPVGSPIHTSPRPNSHPNQSIETENLPQLSEEEASHRFINFK